MNANIYFEIGGFFGLFGILFTVLWWMLILTIWAAPSAIKTLPISTLFGFAVLSICFFFLRLFAHMTLINSHDVTFMAVFSVAVIIWITWAAGVGGATRAAILLLERFGRVNNGAIGVVGLAVLLGVPFFVSAFPYLKFIRF